MIKGAVSNFTIPGDQLLLLLPLDVVGHCGSAFWGKSPFAVVKNNYAAGVANCEGYNFDDQASLNDQFIQIPMLNVYGNKEILIVFNNLKECLSIYMAKHFFLELSSII